MEASYEEDVEEKEDENIKTVGSDPERQKNEL